MRLLVCAGATGGGINPALAVLQALGEQDDHILWVGAEGGMEADLVTRAGIPFTTVPAGGVHGVGLKIFGNLLKLARGYFAARKVIADFKPDVLFFTGGYVAMPVGLAGWRIPTLICLPDIEPGLAIQALGRLADQITAPAEESLAFFPKGKRITVTGYPIRPDLKPWDRAEAFKAFVLDPDKPVLFVTGGSLGARSINRALVKALPQLLPEMQIIHSTGTTTWHEVEAAQKDLAPKLAENYFAAPFLHDRMAAAFTIADLVVSRAGASTIGEFPAFELPAVLVPYPHAWRYQKVNADHLVSRGAALILRDEDLEHDLPATVQELMHNKTKLGQMRSAMKALAAPQAAADTAAILREMGMAVKGRS